MEPRTLTLSLSGCHAAALTPTHTAATADSALLLYASVMYRAACLCCVAVYCVESAMGRVSVAAVRLFFICILLPLFVLQCVFRLCLCFRGLFSCVCAVMHLYCDAVCLGYVFFFSVVSALCSLCLFSVFNVFFCLPLCLCCDTVVLWVCFVCLRVQCCVCCWVVVGEGEKQSVLLVCSSFQPCASLWPLCCNLNLWPTRQQMEC